MLLFIIKSSWIWYLVYCSLTIQTCMTFRKPKHLCTMTFIRKYSFHEIIQQMCRYIYYMRLVCAHLIDWTQGKKTYTVWPLWSRTSRDEVALRKIYAVCISRIRRVIFQILLNCMIVAKHKILSIRFS